MRPLPRTQRSRSPEDDDDEFGLNQYLPAVKPTTPAPTTQPQDVAADDDDDPFGLNAYIPQASTSKAALVVERRAPSVESAALARPPAKRLNTEVFTNETPQARAAREAKVAAQLAIERAQRMMSGSLM